MALQLTGENHTNQKKLYIATKKRQNEREREKESEKERESERKRK